MYSLSHMSKALKMLLECHLQSIGGNNKYKNLNWFCQNKAYRQGRKRGNMPFIDCVAFCTPTLTDFVEKHIVSNYEWRLGVVEIYLILCEYFDGEILEDEGGVLWGTKGRGFGNAFLCLKKRRSL